jgi:hypothetical protein
MIKVIVGFGEKILVFQILLSLAMKLLLKGFYFKLFLLELLLKVFEIGSFLAKEVWLLFIDFH